MKLAPLLLLACSALAVAQTAKKQVSMSESLPASSEHKGAWDLAIWGGGGHRIAGGFRTTQIPAMTFQGFSFPAITVRSDNVGEVSLGDIGFRVGRILTAQHGSGWYRGNFEYAIDLIPFYMLTGLSQRVTFNVPATCPPTLTCPPGFLLPPRLSFSSGSKTAFGGGFNPFVIKWNFTGTRRLSPYFELNGGVLFTNREVPPPTSNVNFMSGATIGMNLFTRRGRAISLDFKYSHISNAGLASPNPGINTLQAQVGYHWFK